MKLIEISNISVYRKGGKSHFFLPDVRDIFSSRVRFAILYAIFYPYDRYLTKSMLV